ncbi:hypothetical protein QYE76_022317 [Lolium multiflorum]|uniref:TF-B3 domain-containing protein n=1 Tax=Lolium multiflorum TaxID=4521 RepID=A0AAD8R8G6_LOLMU|nr:hypothetical protein QYE76_022317 [Lolium multiflorum]
MQAKAAKKVLSPEEKMIEAAKRRGRRKNQKMKTAAAANQQAWQMQIKAGVAQVALHPTLAEGYMLVKREGIAGVAPPASSVSSKLPNKFADYLHGQEPAKVYLRAADCGPRLWTVEVLFDGQGRMYLDKGWEKFAIAHGVDFGWFLHFKYEGDDVLTVKVFDGTMCRRYYYSDDEDTMIKATTM